MASQMCIRDRHNEDYAKQVEAGMKAKGTLLKYKTVYKHLQEFLNIRSLYLYIMTGIFAH